MQKPWRYLIQTLPHVTVHVRPLNDRWGQTVWYPDGRIEIHLAADLGQIQRRVTLAHEIKHVERGKPCTPLCPDDEQEVTDDTARWLLPDPEQIGAALAKADLHTAAEQLLVIPCVVLDRIDCMTDDELDAYIRALTAGLDYSVTLDGVAACVPHQFGFAARRPRRVRTHKCR